VSQYDRTVLRAVAEQTGDHTPSDLRRRLMVAPAGMIVSDATAWRLWNGTHAPSAQVAAAVEAAYGITASDLLRRVKAVA
jgi:transcriptional regulator with XRE-family HTH domain